MECDISIPMQTPCRHFTNCWMVLMTCSLRAASTVSAEEDGEEEEEIFLLSSSSPSSSAETVEAARRLNDVRFYKTKFYHLN